MAYKANTAVFEPLDWMLGEDAREDTTVQSVWAWIEDYADDGEYSRSHALLRLIYDFKGISPERTKEAKREYQELFPTMMGHFFQNIGQAILDGKIEFNVEFKEPKFGYGE